MTGKALTKAEKAYVRTETRLAIVGAIVRLFEELEATSQPYLGEQDIANMHASYCQHACFILPTCMLHIANMHASYDDNQARFHRDYIGRQFSTNLPIRQISESAFGSDTLVIVGIWNASLIGDVNCEVLGGAAAECIKVRWFMSLVLSMTTPLDQSILRNAKYPNRRCSSGGYNFNDLKKKVCKNKQRIGFVRRQGGDFGMGLKVRGCLFGFQCKRSRRRGIRRACHAAGNLSV